MSQEKKLFRILMFIMFGFLFAVVLANFDFQRGKIDTSNWIQYALILLFYVVLFQFWRMTIRVMQQDILKASTTDVTSGLFNSNHFFPTLEAEIDRAKRYDNKLSAIYFDIDYFHRYNESKGIRAGDKVLQYLGDLVQNSTRKYDAGFRLGNDEFVIILPQTDQMQGRIIAERFREGFAQKYGSTLGLSIGISELEEQDNVDRLFRKVESAMEEARRGGGNRIRVYIDRGQL